MNIEKVMAMFFFLFFFFIILQKVRGLTWGKRERGSVGISHALYYQGFDPVGRNWNFAARRLPWEQNAIFKIIITIILTRGSKKISTVVLSWPCEKYMGELIFCTGSISWELGIHASSNELPLILIFWVKLD